MLLGPVEPPGSEGWGTLLVVPVSLRIEVFRHPHDSKTVGHMGICKTLAKVSSVLYWLGSGVYVKRWCRS